MTSVHPQPGQCDQQVSYAAQPPPPGSVQQQPGYGAPGYGMAGQQQPPPFTSFETNNKYKVFTPQGQIFLAAEDTNCCTRNLCGSQRPFNIDILDTLGNPVMKYEAPFRCDSCFCPCCLKKVSVFAPAGNLIGTVEQTWSIFKPNFKITTAGGDTALRIKGPLCPHWELCGDRVFQVYTADGENPCGQITKQWSGLVKELFTDADNFGVTFPRDLDVTVKAVVMGACFLIDFMFFEESVKQED